MKTKPKKLAIDRPFSATDLAKARKAVKDYHFTIWQEDGQFLARCIGLNTVGIGTTRAKAKAEARDLSITVAAFLIESKKRLPLPAE